MSLQDDDYYRGSGREPRIEPPWGREPPWGKIPFKWAWLLWALGVLIVVWGAYTSFYTVQPEERAVVKRLGAVIDQTDPGLHFKLPFGIDRAQRVPTERVLKQEFGFRTVAIGTRMEYETQDFEEESMTLTGDLNIIKVEWVVQYRIADPIKWLYRIRDPERSLRDVSEAIMRQIVGNRLGSDVLTIGRVEISNQAREEIQATMDSFDSGVSINTVELQDVLPTKRVQPAFNDVNIARQEQERMINEAEKRKNQVIPRARGEANQLVAEAEGYAAARVNYAHGEASRFNDILAEYKNAPEVTRRRLYLEMINETVPKAGQVLVVQDGQHGPLPLMDLGRGGRSVAPKEDAK
jgi:membrane protease subunit HflK